MHIQSIDIKNLRLFDNLTWKIGAKPGWNVVIGDNGSGKTAFLRAVALALMGNRNAAAMQEEWNSWLGNDKIQLGECNTRCVGDRDGLVIKVGCNFRVGSHSNGLVKVIPTPNLVLDSNSLTEAQLGLEEVKYLESEVEPKKAIERYNEWLLMVDSRASNAMGFSSGFGPFRRFMSENEDPIFSINPTVARLRSIFGVNVSFLRSTRWLQDLRFKELESGNNGAHSFLSRVQDFINSDDFLPRGVKMKEVNSSAVLFTHANGRTAPVTELSDGYLAVLNFALELLHQMADRFGQEELFGREGDQIFVKCPGVVLVDEIDIHMHPTWQRQIGDWLTKHFPQIQFIVSTHSPLVCQACENGSIFKLAAPGSTEKSGVVEGIPRERLIFGSVLDAYGTELFGADVSRSPTTQEKQERLKKLNNKEFFAELTREEKAEKDQLQAIYPAIF